LPFAGPRARIWEAILDQERQREHARLRSHAAGGGVDRL
jgi:hypothetical protein